MIVFIGDSLTYGYGVSYYDCWVTLLKKNCKINILNKGLNGDTSSGLLFRLYQSAIIFKPSHIFIMGGTNDFLLGRSLENVFDNMKCLIKDIINHNIIPIVGIQIPVYKDMALTHWEKFIDYDTVNKKINLYHNLMIDYCRKNNIDFFDLYKIYTKCQLNNNLLYIDGIHPTPKGHKIIAKNINLKNYI